MEIIIMGRYYLRLTTLGWVWLNITLVQVDCRILWPSIPQLTPLSDIANYFLYLLSTLSWRRPLSYRNQSIGLRSKTGFYMITVSVMKELNLAGVYLVMNCLTLFIPLKATRSLQFFILVTLQLWGIWSIFTRILTQE